jgi:hypothetical protein
MCVIIRFTRRTRRKAPLQQNNTFKRTRLANFLPVRHRRPDGALRVTIEAHLRADQTNTPPAYIERVDLYGKGQTVLAHELFCLRSSPLTVSKNSQKMLGHLSFFIGSYMLRRVLDNFRKQGVPTTRTPNPYSKSFGSADNRSVPPFLCAELLLDHLNQDNSHYNQHYKAQRNMAKSPRGFGSDRF